MEYERHPGENPADEYSGNDPPVLGAVLSTGQATEERTVWLDELDVSISTCGWNSTLRNRSVEGNTLRLGGVGYQRGIGTHAPGEFRVQLDGGSKRFTAEVGIDDETGDLGTAVFKVIGDEKVLWQSGVLRGSDEATSVAVDLTGVRTLRLVVTMAGDGYGHDHTDWVDARLEVTGNAPRNDWKRGLHLRPWAEFNCRSIPGSPKYIATAGPHHGQAFGSLVLIDTTVTDDNEMSQVKRITPDTPFPESETGTRNWKDMAWGSAWPLSEELYLCNYRDTVCTLDALGNRELVCKTLNGMRPIDPIPLRPRRRAPAIPYGTFQGERRTPDAPGATIGIMDVYITDDYGALPAGVRIEQLRVVQLIPKTTPRANDPRIGFGDQSLARIPLGVVPVEEDGSVYFQAPVGKAIYFELLDENGMAVQSMRSATYVHPGEQMTCVGCHEDKRQTPRVRGTPLAMQRAPSELLPEIPDQVMFHFNRQVRPILEQKCASCHRTRDPAGPEEVAYVQLEPYVHYRGHGYLDPKHGGSRTRPGKFGARYSRMGQALLNQDHRKYLEEGRFSERDVRTIVMWLDMNSNELSAYEGVDAQRAGEIVWPALDVDPENLTGVERRESGR